MAQIAAMMMRTVPVISQSLMVWPLSGRDPNDHTDGEDDDREKRVIHFTSLTATPAAFAMRTICAVPLPPGNATTRSGLKSCSMRSLR
jgi:hypothetical protein